MREGFFSKKKWKRLRKKLHMYISFTRVLLSCGGVGKDTKEASLHRSCWNLLWGKTDDCVMKGKNRKRERLTTYTLPARLVLALQEKAGILKCLNTHVLCCIKGQPSRHQSLTQTETPSQPSHPMPISWPSPLTYSWCFYLAAAYLPHSVPQPPRLSSHLHPLPHYHLRFHGCPSRCLHQHSVP